ncbi:hypothetical protein C8N39_10181 [Dietzia psychralcaliphila]|nr:hypothetical protein C8N39_10181 [Dietzia psychralcaliphila]
MTRSETGALPLVTGYLRMANQITFLLRAHRPQPRPNRALAAR